MLLVDSSSGTYVPKIFCESIKNCYAAWRVDKEDLDICLEGPEHIDYWEAWTSILDNAWCTVEGENWGLHQDFGDLFAINTEKMTSEEYLNMFGENKED